MMPKPKPQPLEIWMAVRQGQWVEVHPAVSDAKLFREVTKDDA